jgi:hypothetical protein
MADADPDRGSAVLGGVIEEQRDWTLAELYQGPGTSSSLGHDLAGAWTVGVSRSKEGYARPNRLPPTSPRPRRTTRPADSLRTSATLSMRSLVIVSPSGRHASFESARDSSRRSMARWSRPERLSHERRFLSESSLLMGSPQSRYRIARALGSTLHARVRAYGLRPCGAWRAPCLQPPARLRIRVVHLAVPSKERQASDPGAVDAFGVKLHPVANARDSSEADGAGTDRQKRWAMLRE